MQTPHSKSGSASEFVARAPSSPVVIIMAGNRGGDGCTSAAATTGGGATPLKGVLAGGMSGAIETTLSYPTNYVKTQLQLDERGINQKFTGTFDCIRKTFKKSGVRGFYAGLPIVMCGSIPKVGTRFGTFELVRTFIPVNPETGHLTPAQTMLVGLVGGTVEATLVHTPVETIRTKMIHDQRAAQPKFTGSFQAVGWIFRNQGLSGLYKGLTTTILKQSSNQSVRLCVIESCRHKYTALQGNGAKTPTWLVGVFGVFAGIISAYANAPIDVVKTRMQGLDSHRYCTSWDCARQMYRNEGWRAFYKGTVPRLARVTTESAITFMAYDAIMNVLAKV